MGNLKFDQLKDTVLKCIAILILTEAKLDETFLISQFLIDGFSKPYRFDRNKHGGGQFGDNLYSGHNSK